MNQDFAQAMQRFIEHIRQRHPTSTTAVHYQNDLEQFGRLVDKAPRQVIRSDVSDFATEQLTRGLSAATVNRRLASLSSFFEYLADEAEDDHVGGTPPAIRWCGVGTAWARVDICRVTCRKT